MFVRCNIERKGGTTVTIGGTAYHFEPQKPGGPHIAYVENDEHLERFLTIKAYSLHREPVAADELPQLSAAVELPPNEPLVGSVPVDAVTEPTVAVEETESEIEDNAETLQLAASLKTVLTDPDEATDEQVSEAFEALHSRKPHGQAKRETIIDRTRAAAIEQGIIEAPAAE